MASAFPMDRSYARQRWPKERTTIWVIWSSSRELLARRFYSPSPAIHRPSSPIGASIGQPSSLKQCPWTDKSTCAFTQLTGRGRRALWSNGATWTEIISEFQKRALNEEERELLSAQELKILRAMDLSLLSTAVAWRAFRDQADYEILRKRTESILSAGSASLRGGF